MQRSVRDLRDQLAHHLPVGSGSSGAEQKREREHLQVLADYTLAIGTARYRRVSGRKNWKSYLLRYGRSAAYYDAIAQERMSDQQVEQRLGRIPPEHWRQARTEARQKQSVQLKMFRFKHHREQYLQRLEARWVQALADT